MRCPQARAPTAAHRAQGRAEQPLNRGRIGPRRERACRGRAYRRRTPDAPAANRWSATTLPQQMNQPETAAPLRTGSEDRRDRGEPAGVNPAGLPQAGPRFPLVV